MMSVVSVPQAAEVFYPSSDGEPLAETSVHVVAIINAVVALRQYLAGQQAIVLAEDQEEQRAERAEAEAEAARLRTRLEALGINPEE